MESSSEKRVCAHLLAVDDYLRGQGVRVAAVCTPWSRNCRTWVIYDSVVLDAAGLRQKFDLPDFVIVHSHRGTHEGSEHGLVCSRCWDALIGLHPAEARAGVRVVG
jgi:hypothetical protein